MSAIPSAKENHVRILWSAAGLALFTAVSYVLIALHILGVGDLQVEKDGGAIVYVAAGCYLLGGLLILLRNHWLLLFGAFINAMVILFFFRLYQDRPAVMFSPGGLITKIPQLLLEVTLIYLVMTDWVQARRLSA